MTDDIIKSYMEIDEEHRLQSTLARRVEFLTTIETLTPFLQKKPNILDVGCGTGIYSIYLARQGAKVTAVDLVPMHIQRLKELASQNCLSISTYEGNATDLSKFRDNSFDMVLCLGPLYHLIDESEQNKCISECIRVTKPNGILAFAYISPYSVFPCVLRGDLSRASSKLMESIVDKKMVSSEDAYCFWTDNYFFTPEDIAARLKSFHLELEDHVATDGQSIAFQSVVNEMDETQFQIWLDYHRKTCRVPSLLGSSNHGLVIARKKV
ncbi:MAG: class I SAM-dependent methyltransferase [Lachnospiraceae bacterium]|nr:class I SAM-dependent methyltransferase [Lachnospiraceae bacterium]